MCVTHVYFVADALGEQCVDANGMFFTALYPKNRGMTQIRDWSNNYPLGAHFAILVYLFCVIIFFVIYFCSITDLL